MKPLETLSPALLSLLIGSAIAAQEPERTVISDPYRQGRSITMSQHGIVASSHVLASQAGLDILRAGGNAVDAAVATAAALGVVESHAIGMGGDAFFLYYEAATGEVHAYNGSGRSPKGLSREYFAQKERETIDDQSWEAVTVPGALDAYDAGLKRFGSMTFGEVLVPAIRFAEEGAPVHEIVGNIWASVAGKLRRDDWSKKTWLTERGAPRIGTVFKVPALGRTLRAIAEGGRAAFYEGLIAREIVRYSEASGGWLTLEDFAEHRGEWVTPISTNYRGYDVYQCPPNGQGVAVLMMLNILEGYDIATLPLNSPEYLHTMVETKKLAYADIRKFVGDPSRGEIPTEGLLSKEYAAKRRKEIRVKKAQVEADPGTPRGGDTAYLTVVDSEGNACSFINSLFAPFGTGITGGSTGILLQNRGSGFRLQDGHFNDYKPGVRPFHTIIPGMVLRDGKLYLSYGLMGGSMQPQGHVHFLSAHLDHGLNIQEAIDLPRWRHMGGLEVRLERGISEATHDALGRLGHDARPGSYTLFGSAQAIMVHPETGVLWGASDSRRDGAALGY